MSEPPAKKYCLAAIKAEGTNKVVGNLFREDNLETPCTLEGFADALTAFEDIFPPVGLNISIADYGHAEGGSLIEGAIERQYNGVKYWLRH